MSGKKDHIEICRTSELINSRIKKMSVPIVTSSLCVALVTAIDALVAGTFIGSDALAAVAAAAPLLAIDEILHCLLGFGIDRLIIRSVSRGDRREANRIFGTILMTVFAVYLVVVVLLIVFARDLIALYVKDAALKELVYQYCWPKLAAMPVLECCLCIERAFRVDGRTSLMASRGLVASLLRVLFDFLLVPSAANQVQGLAWASVIGSLLGFAVPISHFFSKKCTIFPDLSVIRSPKEMWGYIREDVRLGGSATLDEVLETLLVTAQTSLISSIGDAAGLAIWSVYKALRSIALSLGNGFSASVSAHAGLLYGEKDYDGVRYSAQSGTNNAQWSCVLVAVLVFVLAGPIADLYKIAPESRELCMHCLRIGCLAFPALAVMSVFTAYLPSIDKLSLTNSMTAIQKGLPYLATFFCASLSMKGYMIVYVLTVFLAQMILEILFKLNGSWFLPENYHQTINSYSAHLDVEPINAVSRAIRTDLQKRYYSERLSMRVALVVEESLSYVRKQNPDAGVRSDIKMDRHETGIQLTIIDDGVTYNPISSFEEVKDRRLDYLETMIINGLTLNLNYDRMLDLNHLVLFTESEDAQMDLVK